MPAITCVIFALLLLFWLRTSEHEQRVLDLVAQRTMDQVADAILESIFLEGFPLPEQLSSDVLGIGLYDSTGEALLGVFQYGVAPPSIDVAVQRPPYDPVFRPQTRSLVLIRPRRTFALATIESGGVPKSPSLPPRSHAETPLERVAYVYVERNGRGYWSEERNIAVTAVVGSVLLVLLCAAVTGLILRNQRYRAKIEAEQRLVRLGLAARTLTHELRNPLASIRIQTELLRTMRSKGSRELEIIEQEVDRLRTLVRRAGEIVKDSRGKPVRVDIVLFLHELVIPFGKDVSVIPPRGGAPYLCGIDPDRLRSILENVIRNALEAGGAPVELAISREKRSVRVDIRDSGPGIPPEHRRRVFDPLFTTKSNGWGVGLNIARQFAEAAGGHLTLTCPSGGGTIITLTMPEAAP